MSYKFEAGQPIKVYRYRNSYGDGQEVWDDAIVIKPDVKSRAGAWYGHVSAKGGYVETAWLTCYNQRFTWRDDDEPVVQPSWLAWPFEIGGNWTNRNAKNKVLPVKTWEETVGATNQQRVADRKRQEENSENAFEAGLIHLVDEIMVVRGNADAIRAIIVRIGDDAKIRSQGTDT